jgi:hypothetical protein
MGDVCCEVHSKIFLEMNCKFIFADILILLDEMQWDYLYVGIVEAAVDGLDNLLLLVNRLFPLFVGYGVDSEVVGFHFIGGAMCGLSGCCGLLQCSFL